MSLIGQDRNWIEVSGWGPKGFTILKMPPFRSVAGDKIADLGRAEPLQTPEAERMQNAMPLAQTLPPALVNVAPTKLAVLVPSLTPLVLRVTTVLKAGLAMKPNANAGSAATYLRNLRRKSGRAMENSLLIAARPRPLPAIP